MILLNIDKKSNQPLYQQVYEQILEIIQKDIIKPGGKLPSTRLLAEKHGISRTSVARAYEELWLRGYTDSSQGSFTFVKSKYPSTSVSGKSEECKVDWNKRLLNCCFQIKEETLFRPDSHKSFDNDFIDMGWFDIDERLIPLVEFKRSINDTIN
ncbi:GntR family transcriptional regulator, partial [candidate division KSB1 bacterium]